ncbi:hypothetical protein CAPTEDRAFT_220407 [Capitella teleta]|uniref:Uncharacterized protein n=1 Tax=Capitella teleta TaxID=283909 RepID=R7VDC9_CAPTE|nr:hypothetical protein CAPTEDRAFT_220407 [Capitella teleta]|eukprot:ELU13665.1 hypothetical protein CAPTEDRAFT_220407 [Capitella teleta]
MATKRRGSHGLSVVDLLRGGALIVGFLAVMFGDKKGSSSIWLKADAVMLGMRIPGVLFPQAFLDMMFDGDYDSNLIFLARPGILYAALIAILYYLTIKDKDDASIGAWLIARTLSMITVLMVEMNGLDALSNPKASLRMSSNRIPTLMMMLVCLGHIVHLLRFQEYASEGRGSSVVGATCTRFHLFIDVLFDFPFLMFYLMYPSEALASLGIKGTGPAHDFLVRMMVAIALTHFLFSFISLQSNNERDQRACLIIRFLGIVLLLPFDVYQHYTTGLWTEMTCGVTFQFVIMGVMTLNSFVGAFYKPKAKTH